MARLKDREKAIKLRLEGKSYSQIKMIIGVNKSTLSYWLKNYPLSEKRISELRDKNPIRIEKYRNTRRKKKEERLRKTYFKEKKKILPLSKRDIFIAGLFLYLGEGTKTMDTRTSLSNTNPSAINFFITWLTKSLKVSLRKIKIYLHLYSDMSVNREIGFWSKALSIPKSQFTKPHIKKSKMEKINYRKGFNHGTCNVIVENARLTERVFAGLKVLESKYGA